MDWDSFFKDNAQSLFTLGGVFLGSLITFVISFLNNRFESRERDKDREEKRKEAKIQAREKWIESDVQRIMDSVEILLKMHSEIPLMRQSLESIKEQEKVGFLTEEESLAKLKLHYERIENFQKEIFQTMDTMTSLAYSLEDEEIESISSKLVDIFNEYIENIELEQSSQEETDYEIWINAKRTAGELRNALRDKMIEIRESEY